jgi:mycothiol synthase
MPSLGALVRRTGFEPERWYREMQRPLTDLPDEPASPGIDLVPRSFRPDLSRLAVQGPVVAGYVLAYVF